MSKQDLEALARWVIAVRPLFANRVIWVRDPEMAVIRRRLIEEVTPARPVG